MTSTHNMAASSPAAQSAPSLSMMNSSTDSNKNSSYGDSSNTLRPNKRHKLVENDTQNQQQQQQKQQERGYIISSSSSSSIASSYRDSNGSSTSLDQIISSAGSSSSVAASCSDEEDCNSNYLEIAQGYLPYRKRSPLQVEYNEVYPPILANTPPPLLSLAQSLVPPLSSEASEMQIKSVKFPANTPREPSLAQNLIPPGGYTSLYSTFLYLPSLTTESRDGSLAASVHHRSPTTSVEHSQAIRSSQHSKRPCIPQSPRQPIFQALYSSHNFTR
jgi:hypothetical protein